MIVYLVCLAAGIARAEDGQSGGETAVPATSDDAAVATPAARPAESGSVEQAAAPVAASPEAAPPAEAVAAPAPSEAAPEVAPPAEAVAAPAPSEEAPEVAPPTEAVAAPAPEAAASPAVAPPAETVAAPVALSVAPPPELALRDSGGKRFDELHLSFVPDEGGAWEVQDGRGRALDARTYALITGDAALLARLEETRRKARRTRLALMGSGAAVALASILPVALMQDTLVANEDTPGFQDLNAGNDVKAAAAFGLVGTGSLLMGLGIAADEIGKFRTREPWRHQDAGEADAAIAAYNARLADQLGVARAEPGEDLGEPIPDDTPRAPGPEEIEEEGG